MRCIIRVDSSSYIGSGHVMRCLALANSLKIYFANLEFVCRDFPGSLHEFIVNKGYKVHLLPLPNQDRLSKEDQGRSWLGMSQELDANETLAIIDKCDLLVVDHYGIDECWESKLRKNCNKLFVVDDLANRKHDCDFLLDYNFYLNASDRYYKLLKKNCKTLLGPEYTPINQEVLDARKWREDFYKISDKSLNQLNCLVFMGGMDENNYTKKIVDALIALKKNLHITVILGKKNLNFNEICNSYKDNEKIEVYIQPDNYYKKLAQADFAIGAGGISTLERFCIGVPAYIFQVAENQREVCENLKYSKAAVCLGNIGIKNSLNMLKQIEFLKNNELIMMGSMGKKIVKGLGLKLIVDRVMRSE